MNLAETIYQKSLDLPAEKLSQAAKKWTMPIHNWKPALNQFMILYGDRLSEVL